MSLFESLQNGVSGLNAASSGLNTTAHNLANTKTAGYTRQQTIQKDMYYQTFKVSNNGAMKIGMGTSATYVPIPIFIAPLFDTLKV